MRTATTEIIARPVIRRDGHLLLVRPREESWSFEPVSQEDHLQVHGLPLAHCSTLCWPPARTARLSGMAGPAKPAMNLRTRVE